jgi:probable phosphoglycerate mutase
VLLIRHGETEWNRVERFRGRADVELNATGLAQAVAVARRLRSEGSADAVYSSPLQRGWQTAEPIAAAFGLQVQPLDGLLDIDYGQWQGLSPAEAASRYPDVFALWLNAPDRAAIPGGETLGQVRSRSVAATCAASSGVL